MRHLLLAGLAAAILPAATPAQVRRGDYLVRVFGCADCHTPLKMGAQGPEPDLDRSLSGHPAAMTLPPPPADLGKGPWMWAGAATNTAFAGPWGVSFAANLTSDPETGIGALSEADFLRTVRTARHLGKGRPILPPMPVQALGQATDQDLKAIYAFLKTTRPVRNPVPDPLPPAGKP